MAVDVSKLVEWLGAEGAVYGLEKSHLTNAELMVIARENGLKVDKRFTRRQLSTELVMSRFVRIDKSQDYLVSMSKDELRRYFTDRMVSDTELISLMTEFGIAPTGNIRTKLADFAAQEISELGMFQRVAVGGSGHAKPAPTEPLKKGPG